MNYIFLDIDGVLNNCEYLIVHQDEDGIVDPECLDLLEKLVKEFDCKIVLSSAWRLGLDENLQPKFKTVKRFDGSEEPSRCARLLTLFEQRGIKICGKTESIYDGERWSRPIEIYCYVKNNLSPNDNYVILDDEKVQAQKGEPQVINSHFVQTDFYYKGFDEKSYIAAAKIFNN